MQPQKQKQADSYRAGTIEAARIIAADPDRYPGVMQEWAAMVLNLAAERTEPGIRRAA
jgi:hypothetical protein